MKKLVCGVVLFFLLTINVNALNVSLGNVRDKLKKSDLYGEFAQDSVNCSITSSNSGLDISCSLTDGVYKTHFDFNKGVLYYGFDGNRNNANTYEETLFDSLWIVQVTDVVADLNGIDIGNNIYTQSRNLFSNNYNFNEHGVEFTYFQYNTGVESGNSIDTFKLYVNDGTVSEESNSGNSSGSSTSKPQTGGNTNAGNNSSNSETSKDVNTNTNANSNNNSNSGASKPQAGYNTNTGTSSNGNSSAGTSKPQTGGNTSTEDSSTNSDSDNTDSNSDSNNEKFNVFFPSLKGTKDKSNNSQDSTEIVSYVVIAILLIIVGAFFFTQRPKRKK